MQLLHCPPSLWSSLSVPADLPATEGASQSEGTFPLSQLPPRGTGAVLITFFFFLLSYPVIFLTALVVWDLLLEFSRYSVRTVPHVDIFLMYLWEEVSSTSFYSAILTSTCPYCIRFLRIKPSAVLQWPRASSGSSMRCGRKQESHLLVKLHPSKVSN